VDTLSTGSDIGAVAEVMGFSTSEAVEEREGCSSMTVFSAL